MKTVWLFLLILFGIQSTAYSQVDSVRYQLNEIRACQELLNQKKTDKAKVCYLKLERKYPNQLKILQKLAFISYDQHLPDDVMFYTDRCVQVNLSEAYTSLLPLAKRMNTQGDPDLALKLLNRIDATGIDSSLARKIENDKTQILLSVNKSARVVPGVYLFNLGDSINTIDNEYLPTATLDDSILVFTRNTKGNEDFFIANKDTLGKWKKAINMGYPPNTGAPDGAASISSDGNYLFYTRCDRRSLNGYESGGCDIAFSFRTNEGWSSPEYFGYTINTTAYEGQTSLSSNNQDLYFVSDREGGLGGKDIWVSHFKHNLWSKPENLGAPINTPKDETSPFIHPDNETLYFSSNGHGGLGMNDVWVAHRKDNNTWDTPLNLGFPINTVGFDGAVFVTAKGDHGYLASDRLDTKGGLDLYRFTTYPGIKPKPTLCMKGRVLDKYHKALLKEVKIQWTRLDGEENPILLNSNEGDASYATALRMGYTYLLQVTEEEGYRPFYKKITLVDTFPGLYKYDIRLKQPGIRDTLYRSTFCFDSVTNQLDSLSILTLDSIAALYKYWTEDSSNVSFVLNINYYSGDSTSDTLYGFYLQTAIQRADYMEEQLTRRGIPCCLIMTSLDMLIYRDERSYFNEMGITVVEAY